MHYNCLIVDDEADLAKMTCEYYEMFDVSCRMAATAEECKSILKEHAVAMMSFYFQATRGENTVIDMVYYKNELSTIKKAFRSGIPKDDIEKHHQCQIMRLTDPDFHSKWNTCIAEEALYLIIMREIKLWVK